MTTQAERLPERWLAEVETCGSSLILTEINREEAAREHLLMGVRLSEGLDLANYRMRWGTEPSPARIAALEMAGLITHANNRLAATPRGQLVLNSIIRALDESREAAVAG